MQSIVSALQHVEPGTLADRNLFDFAQLRALAAGAVGYQAGEETMEEAGDEALAD